MLLLGLTLAACVPSAPTRQEAMGDIFRLLADQGFTANAGLSGIYAPGNVIQTHEVAPHGERPLPSPIVFLWGSDCFPDETPRASSFQLPDSSERRAGSFSIGAGILQRFLPALNLDRAAVADYALTFGNTQVQTYARADLSHQFSEKCVQALAQAIEDGDRIDWFTVIVEAVVAESMALEISWRQGTSLEARTSQRKAAESQLGRILHAAAAGHQPVEAAVSVAADTDKSSILRTDAPVIIGYRVRPLQPVYGG